MGYYLMHRGWLDNDVFPSRKREPLCHPAAWVWLIEHAAFEDNRRLRRGQLLHSLRYLRDQWGWKTTAVVRFIQALRDRNMIETATETAGTLITICNYDKYQAQPEVTGTPSGRRPERDRNTTGTTNKEGKKESKKDSPPLTLFADPPAGEEASDDDPETSKENGHGRGPGKTKRATRLAPSWEPSERDRAFAVECGLDPDEIAASFRDYWISLPGGRSTKLDWSATFRNWCRKERDSHGNRGGRSGGGGRGSASFTGAMRDYFRVISDD